ncbi:MAG: hypothetical protein GX589_04415 [Deltaproteobacteria bacterium]|nr:hypothetical protein [Deltaproteobacteria bacterium]
MYRHHSLVISVFLARPLARPGSKRSLALSILPILLALNGCLRTVLTNRSPTAPASAKLAALNTRPMFLKITNTLPSSTSGHQYLFLVLPFGAVEVKDPALRIWDAAFTKLSLRGYRPIAPGTGGSAITAPTLEIKLTGLQTSAYDLLVSRRIVCRVDIASSLISSAGVTLRGWEASGRSTAFKGLAFAPELEWVLGQALDQALDETLTNLRL